MNLGIYKNLPTKLHLEPTTECNARCPQCPRTFNSSLLTQPRLKITEWNPQDLKSVLEDEFFKDLNYVLINGNYGDIVMHSNPKELIQVLLDRNVTYVVINTNGGALNAKFWSWLGSLGKIIVEFGIDGLEDTHHLYRRNTRFDVVMKNAKAFIDAGGYAYWVMTTFKHNEHQIEDCKRLSKEFGFKQFKERPSTRWDKKDHVILGNDMEESYRLEPATSIADRFKDLPKSIHENVDIPLTSAISIDELRPQPATPAICEISCSVAKDNSVYLSAGGNLYPCCWTANEHEKSFIECVDSSFVKTFHKELGYNLNFNNVIDNKISDIIDSGLFTRIEDSWFSSKQINACAKTCGIKSNYNYQVSKSNINIIKDSDK